jgi:hypothetical protein
MFLVQGVYNHVMDAQFHLVPSICTSRIGESRIFQSSVCLPGGAAVVGDARDDECCAMVDCMLKVLSCRKELCY